MSQAGKRLLDVLNSLQQAPRPLTTAEVARHTGLPEPTAWRMLRTLTEWGGVERQADGRYRIAVRLWAVGASAPCVRRLREDTSRYLRQLRAETGMNAAVAVYDGTEATLVSSTSPREREGDRVKLGSDSLVGRALASVHDGRRRTSTTATSGTAVVLAHAITAPDGSTAAVVTLTGDTTRHDLPRGARVLHALIPRIRSDIYRDELVD